MTLLMTLLHHTRTREGEVQPGGTDRSRSFFRSFPHVTVVNFGMKGRILKHVDTSVGEFAGSQERPAERKEL